MKRLILITGFLIFFAGLASSTSISEENITVDLEHNTVDAEIHFNDLTSSSFTYITNHPVENYAVEINSEPVECEFNEMTLGGEIVCPTTAEENFTVDLTYKTSGLVDEQEGIKIFRYSQSIYRPIENYNFKVMLPEGTGLLDQSEVSTPVIEPENGEIGSEGRRIHIEWTHEPSLGSTESFQVTYEGLETEYRNIIIIITGLILSLGAFKAYRSRQSKEKASEIIDTLTEHDNQVFNLLKQEDGSMLQKDIVNKSEYSKAKISGVVSSLEEKGLVTKEKEGRSNRVKVKDKFLT